MKIKRLIMTMLIVFSLVPLYLVGGMMILEHEGSIEKLQRENLEALGNTIVLNIESYCRSQKHAMQLLARSSALEHVLMEAEEGRPDKDSVYYRYMQKLLRERLLYEEYVVSVSVADSCFRIVGTTDASAEPDVSDFDVTSGGIRDESFFIGRAIARETSEGVKNVVLACQKIVRDDICIGYVLEEIDTAFFDRMRQKTTFSPDDIIYIRDGVGGLITAGNFGDPTYSERAQRVTDCASFQKKWNSVNHSARKSGAIRFRDGGVRYMTYYSDIAATDWLIFVTVNVSKRFSLASSYSLVVGITLVCLTLVLFGVNFVLTRKITQPLDQIGRTLASVQEHDDYSVRIHVSRRGELGAIAEQINRLLEYVEERSRQSEQKTRELKRDGKLDPLTGLLNKKAVHSDMQELMRRAKELETEIITGFVDIDNFRRFNTDYGHQIGDLVIKYVAESLRQAVPGTVGRNGGDEFIFCMLNRRRDVKLDRMMDAFYERLREGIATDDGQRVSVTCSVGIVQAKGGRYDLEELEKRADDAMYEAKNRGRNNYHIIWDE